MQISIDKKRVNMVIAVLISFLETVYICNLVQLSEKELFWTIFLGGAIVNSKITRIALELKNENKLYGFFSLAISFYISFAFYVGKQSWKISPDGFLTCENLLISACGVPFIWVILIYTLSKLNAHKMGDNNTESYNGVKLKKNSWILVSICIFICWIPALIVNYPGIIISDYTWQYSQALGESALTNHHPIIHTMLIRFSQWLSGIVCGQVSAETAVLINSIVQMSVMAGVVGYVLLQIAEQALLCSRCVKWVLLGVGLWYALFPMYSLFGIYMTKDVLFSGCCFLWSFFLYRDFKKSEEGININPSVKITSIIQEAVVAILIIFLRSNGFIVVFGTLFLAIIYKRKFKRLWIILGVSLIAWLLQTPILKSLSIPQTEFVEAIGMPINQIANVVIHNEELTDYERDLIENVMPLQTIKEAYNVRYSDHLKFNPQFNGSVIDENKIEYLKLWAKLFLKYPKDYLEAGFNLTIGYWYPGVDKGCISYNYDERTQFLEQIGVTNYSVNTLYKHFITESVRENIFEAAFWSPGLAVMLLLILLLLCVGQKFYSLVMMFLPEIFGWVSLLIATPSYCETRYVYFVFLTLPAIIVCMLIEKETNYGQDRDSDTML